MEQRKRRFFPLEFKREAVAQVEASGRPVGAIAGELGLCDTVVRKCVRQLGSGGRATAPPTRPTTQAVAPPPADQAAEIARLKRELERTRMERAILKKAVIFGKEPR